MNTSRGLGLSKAGRLKLHAELRDLKRISPWPGALHLLIRLPLQAALWWWACQAWVDQEYGIFILATVFAGLCFASLMSLSHDALHHRLTGVSWLDEFFGRLISWPIAWPIGAYKYVHLIHHQQSGSDLADPERISPLAADWEISPLKRAGLRNQLWLAMFVTGAAGLAHKILVAVFKRWHIHSLRRAFIVDVLGIVTTVALLGAAAFWAQGWPGLLGFLIAWFVHERLVGALHQFRNHMEHYGLWGEQASTSDTQYTSARTIKTNLIGRLFFNGLNRHAEHHLAPAIPFYKLEAAHILIACAYEQEGFASVETNGYTAALREVLVLMHKQYCADKTPTARLQKNAT